MGPIEGTVAVVKDICVHRTELCFLTQGEQSLGPGPARCVWSQHFQLDALHRPQLLLYHYFTELSAANVGSQEDMSPGYTSGC